MLPNILDIANQHAIILDGRTLKKNEVRAKCPFCLEDSHKPNKHYLSLNVIDNVYKCWHCSAKGGVLDFESRLSGESYEKVKAKYFQGRGASKPSLNTRQLEAIGLDKQMAQVDQQELFAKWKMYEESQLSRWFAEYVVCSYLPQDRAMPLLETISRTCKKSPIRNANERITYEFYKEDSLKSAWAIEGLKIARIAWQMALDTNFFDNVVSNVAFIHFLAEKKKASYVQMHSQIS